MAYRDWLPASWLGDKNDEDNPFGSLRKQIDTLFEDFDKGFLEKAGSFNVRSNVSETDDAICITVELPGIERDDIDISVTGSQITVKGEKKSEKDEKGEEDGRKFHRVERSSGSFRRSISLPFEIDADKVQADTKDGVLTVTIPKPPKAVTESRKVEIKTSGQGAG